MDRGSYIQFDDRPAVRFERVYPHPIDQVWSAVTAPGELAHWFPSSVSYEPHVGATITFAGDPNLDPTDGGTRLVLINVLAERNTAARNASGWHVCLAELEKQLGGIASAGPHSEHALSFRPLYDDYVAAGLPSGAWTPGES
jgi:hypothetical protein